MQILFDVNVFVFYLFFFFWYLFMGALLICIKHFWFQPRRQGNPSTFVFNHIDLHLSRLVTDLDNDFSLPAQLLALAQRISSTPRATISIMSVIFIARQQFEASRRDPSNQFGCTSFHTHVFMLDTHTLSHTHTDTHTRRLWCVFAWFIGLTSI